MATIVYLDETGDHSLEKDDKDFPLFVLTMVVCDDDEYIQKIVPSVNRLKFDYFGHEGIIFHSREIRKAQKDFNFLLNPNARQPFYERINQIMREADYKLIVTAIRKQDHRAKYGTSVANPYDLSLTFSMERLLHLLEANGDKNVYIMAESRGKKEDAELENSFLRIISYGTDYCSADRFKRINLKLCFRSKLMNIVGMQLADLAGYPIARKILNPERENPAYETIADKFYESENVRGLKVFP